MLFMKFEGHSGTYHLTAEAIDEIAAAAEAFLFSLKMERSNVLRIRLSLEEALLRWRDHFGEEKEIRVEMGMRWLRPQISLELTGESCDPFQDGENELGMWANSLLGSIGLSPRYSYQRGTNYLQLKLNRPRRNPVVMMLISVALGILFGLLGELALPETVQQNVLRTVLDPLQNVFFRILNVTAAPVVFLSVLTATCGVGSVAAVGKNGRRMILHFLTASVVIAVLAMAILIPLFRLSFLQTPLTGTQFSGVLDFFLQIVPNDALSPFIQGDFPQLILIAFVLGYALLIAGRQTDALMRVIEQVYAIGLIVAEWVGKLMNLFVALLLVLWIMNGSATKLVGLWKPLLIFHAIVALMLFINLLRVSIREKVPVKKLISKMKESFFIALRSASVDSAFGANRVCCERRLGIDSKNTEYSLPLGLVIYMPAGVIAIMTYTLYSAQCYAVNASVIWYLMLVLLAAALQIATPPMTGVALLSYVVLFSRLGIPIDALTLVLIADIISSFAVAAADQAMLQMGLVIESDRTNQLDREILRR